MEPIFGITSAAAPSAPQSVIEEPTLEERIRDVIPPAELPDVISFLIARGQLKTGQGLGDLSQDCAQRVLAQPERFLSVVRDWVSKEDKIPGIGEADAERPPLGPGSIAARLDPVVISMPLQMFQHRSQVRHGVKVERTAVVTCQGFAFR